MRFAHPIYSLPFAAPVDNELAEEFAALSFGRRFQALRKTTFRELAMLVSGQARRRVARAPASMRHMLWVYTWTTVGDAIMELGPRQLIPPHIAVDLLIAPHLAPLFANDRRFRHVHADIASCAKEPYDFVLLDSLRTTSLRLKTRSFAALPFATMREHQAGERFDRTAYADRRLRQLFGLGDGEVRTPHLDLGATAPPASRAVTAIAVALGARVERNRYRSWPQLLEHIRALWPRGVARPEFHLLGQGASAHADVATFEASFVAAHARVRLDSGDLADVARDVAACAAFLGVDGGLMHVAIGVGTPGLGLFARMAPRFRLRPGSSMVALATDQDVDGLGAEQIARAFIGALPGFIGGR